MGSFNTFYTFFSTRVLPQNNNTTTEDVKEYTQPVTKSRHHRTFSDPSSAMLHKEAVQKLFPCDNRHSFNPHYQHNLHTTSTSTIYSTPPSLASSPTDSSPSSTTSSSHSHTTSPSYTMTQATQKPFYQQPHPRRSQTSSSTRQRQQQQQHYHQRHFNYSYSRQQARRLNQRNHANHHDIDNMDDDLLIGYDNQQIYYGSGSSTSMARVHPSGSPSYDTYPSFPSSSERQYQQRQQQQHAHSGYISALSYPPRLSENERTMSPASRSLFAAAASAVKSSIQYGQASSSQLKPQYPQHHQQQHQGRQQRRAEHARHQSAFHFLPSISERRATMHMHEEEDVYAFDHASEVAASASVSTADMGEIRTVASNSSSSLSLSSSSSSSSTSMTAKQSLLRIARCDPRQDNWCSQQSGQWTRLYAQTRSNGPLTDGRRTRRL
ncbi:hypothetical protein BG015_010619 [Linnemannia schmuckeri]|uniref:Uncharacterized protein n=1 Tax=Linnemannia schmuckeri TaxID=64567 RepID=A0A9P5S7M3_9FUNG|nr:hypothetical protein BG015_010619 [Linnemannia schmuckeri]